MANQLSVFYNRIMTAITTGVQAFTDPESLSIKTDAQRLSFYSLAWFYYKNKVFSTREGETWTTYLSDRKLYKHIRLIYNPVPQIVDFYVDNIWAPANNDNFPNLVTDAVSKNEEFLSAIGQVDQWSNWLSESQKAKKYASVTGNCLIEVVDDVPREKVTSRTHWAGFVKEFELDSDGNLQSYVLEYKTTIDKKERQFRKEVDKNTAKYFIDNEPYATDSRPAVVELPYGFCPAVWIKHSDDGSDYGSPSFIHYDKIDEVNGLGSHLHDNIHKNIESPKVIASDAEIIPISGATDTAAGLAMQDPRLNWVLLKAAEGASVHDLAGNLQLAEAHPYLLELLKSFNEDYPELQFPTIIRESSNVSGIALGRLLTPAQNKLNNAQANYNQQLVKLRQMQVAIAGFRQSSDWKMNTDQQKRFAPFDLESYRKGELDFQIEESQLINLNEMDEETLMNQKADRAVKLTGIVDQKEQLKILGYADDEIEEMIAAITLARGAEFQNLVNQTIEV